MRLMLHYLKKHKLLLLINFISVFGFALVELGIPTIVAEMIDNGVVGGGNRQYIYQMGGWILAISLLGVGGTILLGFCCARISSAITENIRNDVFRKAQTFSHSEFGKFGISSMITRTNNDAFQIQIFMNVLLRIALMTPIMIVSSFIMTFSASVELSYIIVATIPLIVLGVIFVARKSEPISEKQQVSLDTLNRISRENLTGIRVIRAFGNDAYEEGRFNRENNQYMGHTKKMFKLMMLTQPTFFFLMNMAGLVIFCAASVMIDRQQLQIGQLVAFVDYLFHAMMSVMLFCTVFMMYPKAVVSALRIKAILDTDPAVKNPRGGKQMDAEINDLEFDRVTFVYPDGEEAVLHDISFRVRRGETVAFIGSTGSGKSTLINLVPRFYDVTGGAVRINGTDLREYDLFSLRDKIGFIPQKAMLFSGSIADNIRFGKKDASMQEVEHAAKVAQAYDFITQKPHGFEERITEGASNVSGGQKQRLSIARALVRRPQIYVFDDSFSALDFKTDAKLRQELKAETRDSIVMIVAQRVSSIMDADQIVVLNEGNVVGIGTHQELLEICPVYYEIAASQLSEEELAR